MRWRIADIEISPDDVVLATGDNNRFQVSFVAEVRLTGRRIVLRHLRIQGAGANTMGPETLISLAVYRPQLRVSRSLERDGSPTGTPSLPNSYPLDKHKSHPDIYTGGPHSEGDKLLKVIPLTCYKFMQLLPCNAVALKRSLSTRGTTRMVPAPRFRSRYAWSSSCSWPMAGGWSPGSGGRRWGVCHG